VKFISRMMDAADPDTGVAFSEMTTCVADRQKSIATLPPWWVNIPPGVHVRRWTDCSPIRTPAVRP
jgi:hypothetical protein